MRLASRRAYWIVLGLMTVLIVIPTLRAWLRLEDDYRLATSDAAGVQRFLVESTDSERRIRIFLLAVKHGNREGVRAFLDAGMDPDQTAPGRRGGARAVQIAAHFDQTEMVEMLEAAGVRRGEHPLEY